MTIRYVTSEGKMTKQTKKQFIEAFTLYCKEQNYLSILSMPGEFKTENWMGERMFVHQYQDGQIERKETYHFDGTTITCFKLEKRYDYGAHWMNEQ